MSSQRSKFQVFISHTGEDKDRIAIPLLSVCCLAITKDDRLIASGSYDKSVRFWNHETGTSIACFKGHDGIVFSVNVSGDCRRVVSGSADMTVIVWDVQTRSQLAVLRGHTRPVLVVYPFSKGESVVSCSGDGTVRVWDVTLAQESREQSSGTENRHGGVVLSVAISGNGKVAASGSTDETLRLWDIFSGKQLGRSLSRSRQSGLISINES